MLKQRFMHWLVAVLLIVGMFCQGTRVLAGTTGGLSGTVLDENGAPVTAASVTIASPSAVNHATTDAAGKFNFLALIPDTYVLSVEKPGYEPTSVAGVTIVADQTPSLNVTQKHALRQIARVTSRAASSLVKPGTVTDVYSITQTQQDKIQGVGGGGNLNSAWSAIATVPGVFVAPNQAGYIGAGPTLSIRGGDYDQIGYEIDGVPVNRSFDNYPSGPASSLGQQELQVYTGVPPANAEANGLAGFINQVIRTGTYPGFGNADIGIGGPSYYHKASFEIGGSTPNRNFSYYIGIGGYNQDFRVVDQSNGAGIANLYGIPLTFCLPTSIVPTMTPANSPSCYTNGQYNGNTVQNSFNTFLGLGGVAGLPAGSFLLGGTNLFSLATVADRDNVVNLHFGLPHKDGTKDDIQVLGMVNYIQNTFYDSTNDQGGAAFLGNTTLGVPFIVDGYQFNSPTGVPLPANYQSLASIYTFPNVGQHSFDAPIPPAQRGGFENDQAIYKVQYTHTMGTNALFKVYGYSYYSDWLNTSTQSLYADFFGCCPNDYELSSHTRGVSGSLIDQINSQNLINFTGSWTNSNTTRDNNTEMVNGLYGSGSINARTGLAVLVDSTNPTDGICYTITGAPTTCNEASHGAQWATLKQAYNGTITPIPAGLQCGGGPCEYFVTGNGLYATYNQVKPTFFAGSLTDVFRPTNKLTINMGLRFDDFQYETSDTTGSPARTLFYNAFNMDTCQDSGGNLFDKVKNLGVAITTPCSSVPGMSSITVTNPGGNQTFTFPEWQPRLGFTYELDPFTVVRASYGRYAQGPNSAFVQYNALQQNAPALLYGTYSFQKFGFTTPDHPIRPSISNNYDFSVEHQFKGDVSLKLTPFLRKTQDQVQQFFLNQQTSFVSGLNVGRQTSQGFEFELDKGDFDRQGLSGRLTFTYTNSYINYTPLLNGSSVLTPINGAIANYNAYTSACAPGGHLAGSPNCGATITGSIAAPCYTVTGAADNSCSAGSVANPYWNAPAQGLLNPNANYPTYDILTQGVGSAVDGYGAPYVASLVLNERVKQWSFAPIVQMFAGQRYGAPETTEGIAPDTCSGILGSSLTGDPRYPYGAVGGNPFDATSCSNSPGGVAGGAAFGNGLPIPNPYTGAFDGIGAFVAPTQLQLHFQMSYEASKNVTFVANFTNIVSTCFGGTKVKWAPSNVCGYSVVGGGSTGDVGNLYNPGAVIQPYVNTPYEPTFQGLPFGFFVNAKIKI